MNVSLDDRLTEFVDALVREGRYGSADEVVSEALRLFEKIEQKRSALRDHLNAAIERGGSYTDEEVGESIDQALSEWDVEKRKRA